MDEDIVRWVLEFLLRQPIDDSVINALLSVLPIANNDSRLKKTLLLRRIDTEVSYASVSEKIMELLEIVEELDHRDGKSASELMKAAYCAVAVDCTVRFLEESVETNGKYLEAVKRIWRKKLSKMEKLEKNGGGLVSENLLRWRDDIEAAITDSIVRDKILMSNTRNEALKAVRAYLKESWESMGPSFLEYVVQTMSKMENKELGTGDEAMDDQLGKGVEKGVSACHKFVVSHNTTVDEGGSGGVLGGGEQVLTVNEPAVGDKETRMGNIQLRHKHVAPHGRRFKSVASRSRGAKVSDADEVDKDIRMDKNDHLLSPEADKVQGALKSTSMELHKAVKDPLPEALQMSETMAAGIGRDDTDSETAAENLSRGEVHVPSASIDNAAEEVIKNKENTTRDVCGTENTSSGQDNKSQNILPRFGLMDRNPTAQTHSWDDSIENTTDGSPDRPHLPSPKRVNVSPLKNYQVVKFMRRRKRKKWCPEEEETLRTGVKKYGIGNWKLILNVYRNIFEERTEVDLKDKWRNLTREGRHH